MVAVAAFPLRLALYLQLPQQPISELELGRPLELVARVELAQGRLDSVPELRHGGLLRNPHHLDRSDGGRPVRVRGVACRVSDRALDAVLELVPVASLRGKYGVRER